MERAAIREWIETRRGLLESAQASGKLARTKLDIKDAARAALPAADVDPHFFSMLDEELDAFCADMRLASVTVQQQIERIPERPARTGLAIIAAIVVGAVVLFIAALNVDNPALGFGLPILAAVITFFVVR